MSIQWFPGHMAKARREIEERLKIIDIVIELVDGRAPFASKNPMFDDIIKNKPRLIVITKKDLADQKRVDQWMKYYRSLGYLAISVNLKNFNDYKTIIQLCQEALKVKMEKERARGLKPRPVRAMVVGIPNVGKSTFINRLASRKATITGNRPGVTKAQQIIRVNNDFELFDTPGVLWPKFENETVARNIALIGSIKSTILPLDELIIYALQYLEKHYPGSLNERYQMGTIDFDGEWIEDTFTKIAASRHLKKINGETDYDRVIEIVLKDLLDAAIAKVTWEVIEDYGFHA
ncbi:MAG: ribosome biogenesis GTPase YlqF [Beduini sp.]|uniref:ribosome biogenesis GTPase YlqF n=1 Tax=Beduini sp. TaxID=1922300 RepID=UPI0039A10052